MLLKLLLGIVLSLGQTSRPAPAPETLLVIEPTAEHPRNSEGDIIELKDGSLLLAYSRFSGGGADDSRADICARVSRDGGQTWSDDRVLVLCEGKANVMSVSLVRLNTGEILLFYLRKNSFNDCRLYVRRSSDELATLSEPICATPPLGYHVVNNARVLLLPSGGLVVPAAVHPCPDEKTFDGHGIPRTFFSDDGGHTWRADATAVRPVPRSDVILQEPGVLLLEDGRLWMWLRASGGYQYASVSHDLGQHWSEPRPTGLASPLSPASLKRVPWTGDLLAVWNDHRGRRVELKEKRTPLSVALSADDGRSWSAGRPIESDPEGCFCYTSITWVKDRAILAYSCKVKNFGSLAGLKIVALPRDWLYPPGTRPAAAFP